jgi:hypothetical protein
MVSTNKSTGTARVLELEKEREERDFSVNNSLRRVVIASFSRGFACCARLAPFPFTRTFTSEVEKEVGMVNMFR